MKDSNSVDKEGQSEDPEFHKVSDDEYRISPSLEPDLSIKQELLAIQDCPEKIAEEFLTWCVFQ